MSTSPCWCRFTWEMADGWLLSLGRARMLGNTSLEQKVPLKAPKERPKRAVISYYDDVLANNWQSCAK
ncbi:MAG TPA: hypothetical protein VEV41_27190 [Terriglobales bacterium]|nr:hypothetical protein [Terriglobales bacterium]